MEIFRTKKRLQIQQLEGVSILPAEREGFEPSVQLPVQRFSRPSHSTTLASFLKGVVIYLISANLQKIRRSVSTHLHHSRRIVRFTKGLTPLKLRKSLQTAMI